MARKGLKDMFEPKSIAVIGASREESSVGYGILKSLVQGCVMDSNYCVPFPGKIYPVNPKADEILNTKCYKSVLDIEGSVELAVIAVKAKIVPFVLEECGKKGVRFAIIISAGFAEIGEEGKKMQDEILKIAKNHNIRIVGPNCLGIIRTYSDMNASFAPTMPPKGPVGFISQSGALADSIIDWAVKEKYGLSTLISYGNRADLDVHDFIEFLGEDDKTKAIAIYMEGLEDGRKFMEVCKRVTKKKPIIVLKAGRTEAGSKAISSHTGSLAGSYDIYKTAFKQCGVIAADNVEELFDIAKSLAYQPPCKENSIGIITNGGGCGVLCADSCEELGINLAELDEETLTKLDDSGKMHPAYSRRNPLDLVGDALPERYDAALNALLESKDVHGLIVIQTLQTMTDPIKDAEVIIKAHKKFPKKPILCNYMGGLYSKKGGTILEDHNIPDFNDVKKAAVSMKALIERGKLLKKPNLIPIE